MANPVRAPTIPEIDDGPWAEASQKQQQGGEQGGEQAPQQQQQQQQGADDAELPAPQLTLPQLPMLVHPPQQDEASMAMDEAASALARAPPALLTATKVAPTPSGSLSARAPSPNAGLDAAPVPPVPLTARPSTSLPSGFGSKRFQAGVNHLLTQQLTSACELFLRGLVRAPDDQFMERGFTTGHERFKYSQPVRWSRWPFAPVEVAAETGSRAEVPPGPMPPPDEVFVTTNTVEVDWPAYTLRTDVPGDVFDGYHLDIAHLCPIDGPGEWQRAYKGNRQAYVIRGLSLIKDVLCRVRAYNGKGGGEWSEVRRFRVLKKPPPKLVEHRQMPPRWRTVEIEDVIKATTQEVAPNTGYYTLCSPCSWLAACPLL